MKKLFLLCITLSSQIFCMEKPTKEYDRKIRPNGTEAVYESLKIMALVKHANLSQKELEVAQSHWNYIQDNINQHGINIFLDPKIESPIFVREKKSKKNIQI